MACLGSWVTTPALSGLRSSPACPCKEVHHGITAQLPETEMAYVAWSWFLNAVMELKTKLASGNVNN